MSLWLVNLIPGAGFALAGFPRVGMAVGVTTLLFWLFAWPFAIPVHLAAWLTGINVVRCNAGRR